MCYRTFHAVLKTKTGSPTDKVVLMVLAASLNSTTGECFPSVPTIARLAELTERSVYQALDRLEKAGFIKREKLRKNNFYTLNVVQGECGSSLNDVQGSPERGAPSPLNDVHPNRNSNRKGIEDTSSSLRSSEVAPPADRNGHAYAFEEGVIRLNAHDLEKWRKAFPAFSSLEGELIRLAPWAGKQGKNWFYAVAGALGKKHDKLTAPDNQQQQNGGEYYINRLGVKIPL